MTDPDIDKIEEHMRQQAKNIQELLGGSADVVVEQCGHWRKVDEHGVEWTYVDGEWIKDF